MRKCLAQTLSSAFIAFAIPFLFLASGCKETPTETPEKKSAGSTMEQTAGPATSLVLSGPATAVAGKCTGPFTLEALDENGNVASAFTTESQWEIVTSGAVTFFRDENCETALTEAKGSFAGAPVATFSLKSTVAGPLTATVTGPGDLHAAFDITVVAATAAKVFFTAPNSVAQGACVGISVSAEDAFGNDAAIATEVSWQVNGIAGANTFSDSACAAPLVSTALENASRNLFFRGPAGGTATIDFTSAGGLESPSTSITVLAPDVHRLRLFADASAVVGTCIPFRAEAQKTVTDATPVFVSLGTAKFEGMPIFSDDQCATPFGSETAAWPENSTSLTVFVSITAPGARTLAVSADGLVSDSRVITWSAGAPDHFQLSALPTGKAKSVLGPVTVTLLDKYGNTAVAPSALEIALSASGEASAGSTFHRTLSQGDRISQVTVPINESSADFFFRAIEPGDLILTLTSPNVVTKTAQTTISAPDPELGSFSLSGPSQATAGACTEITLSLRDQNNVPYNVTGQDLAFTVTAASAQGTLHRDENCSQELTGAAIGMGTASTKFYYRDTMARESTSLLATSGTWSSSLALKIIAAVPAKALLDRSLVPASQFQCLELPYHLEDAFGNAAQFVAETTLDLDAGGRATFSTIPGCTPATSTFTLGALTKTFSLFARPALLGTATLKLTVSGAESAIGDNSFEVTAPAAVEVALSPAGAATAGDCVPVALQFRSTEMPTLMEPAILRVTSDPSLVQLSSSPSCADPQGALDVSVPSFQTNAQFFFRATFAQSYFFDVTGPFNIHGGRSITVVPRTPSKLVFVNTGSGTVFKGVVNGPFTLEAQDEYGNAASPAAQPIGLTSANGEIAFFADAAGAQNGAAFGGGSQATFYFRPEFTGAADVVAVLPGLTSATRNFQVENVAELAFVSDDHAITSLEAGTLRLGGDAKVVALSLRNNSQAADATSVVIELPEGGITRSTTSTCATGPEAAVSAAQTCALVLEIRPDTLTRTGGPIRVTYRNLKGEQSLELSLHFTVRESTVAELAGPSELIFGDVNIGETKTLNFTLTNSGDLAPGVLTVQSSLPEFANTVDGLSGSVTFTPATNEALTGKITIAYGAKSLEINVTGRGRKVAKLAYSSTNLNFGSVIAGETKSLVLIVRNDGDLASGTIAVTAPTGAFSLTGALPATLAAGESAELPIRFAPQASGSFGGEVTIKEASSAADAITLGGQGQTLATPVISPDSLNFDLVLAGKNKSLIAFLKNNGDVTYDLVTAEKTGSTSFTVSASACAGLAPGAECPVNITYTPTGIPTASSGTASLSLDSGTVKFKGNSGSVERTSNTLAYQGQGTNGANVGVTSPALAFGGVPIGSSKSMTFTVKNFGPIPADAFSIAFPTGQPLTLGAATPATCSGPLAVGSSCSFEIIFSPTSSASLTGTSVLSFHNGVKVVTLNVATSGSGAVDGKITVSNSGYNYGAVVVGNTTGQVSYVVRNVGTTIIENISLPVPSPYFVVSNNCSRLTVNQSCTLVVKFAPTQVGTNSVNIPITYNTVGSVPVTSPLLALNGSGVAPARLAVSANPFDFGKQIVGLRSANKVLTITNEGSATATSITATGTLPDGTAANLAVGPVILPAISGIAAQRSLGINVAVIPPALGTFTVRITLKYLNGVTGAPPQEFSFDIAGEGVPAPELVITTSNPSAIEFGSTINRIASAPQSITVTNNGAQNITSLARVLPTGFTLTPSVPTTLAAGATQTFNLVWTPTVLGAIADKVITFNYVSGGVARTASRAITGTSIDHPLPTFSESPIALGTVVTRRENTAKTVQISYSGPNLSSARFSVSNGSIKVVSTTCPASPAKMTGNCEVVVNTTTSLTAVGALSYNLTMAFTDGGGTARTVVVPVTMDSKNPANLVGTPTTVAFGNVSIANPILPERVLVIENKGGMPATNIVFQPIATMQPLMYRTDSTCLTTTTLLPGQTCTLSYALAGNVTFVSTMTVPVKVSYESGAVAPVVNATPANATISFR